MGLGILDMRTLILGLPHLPSSELPLEPFQQLGPRPGLSVRVRGTGRVQGFRV